MTLPHPVVLKNPICKGCKRQLVKVDTAATTPALPSQPPPTSSSDPLGLSRLASEIQTEDDADSRASALKYACDAFGGCYEISERETLISLSSVKLNLSLDSVPLEGDQVNSSTSSGETAYGDPEADEWREFAELRRDIGWTEASIEAWGPNPPRIEESVHNHDGVSPSGLSPTIAAASAPYVTPTSDADAPNAEHLLPALTQCDHDSSSPRGSSESLPALTRLPSRDVRASPKRRRQRLPPRLFPWHDATDSDSSGHPPLCDSSSSEPEPVVSSEKESSGGESLDPFDPSMSSEELLAMVHRINRIKHRSQGSNETHTHVDDTYTAYTAYPTYVPESPSISKVIAAAAASENAQPPSVYINIRPGTSLADTAAQRGVIGIKAFRALEKLLHKKFGLRPRLLNVTLQADGVGGSGKCLGTVEWPLGLPGYNGVMQMTVIDNERVPPLTPIGMFTELKTIIDLGKQTLTYENSQSQDLEVLPSGHIAHSIVDFTKAWEHPDHEIDKHFRYARGETFKQLSFIALSSAVDTQERLEFSSSYSRSPSHSAPAAAAASSPSPPPAASVSTNITFAAAVTTLDPDGGEMDYHRHTGHAEPRVTDRTQSSQTSRAQQRSRARSRGCLFLAACLSQVGEAHVDANLAGSLQGYHGQVVETGHVQARRCEPVGKEWQQVCNSDTLRDVPEDNRVRTYKGRCDLMDEKVRPTCHEESATSNSYGDASLGSGCLQVLHAVRTSDGARQDSKLPACDVPVQPALSKGTMSVCKERPLSSWGPSCTPIIFNENSRRKRQAPQEENVVGTRHSYYGRKCQDIGIDDQHDWEQVQGCFVQGDLRERSVVRGVGDSHSASRIKLQCGTEAHGEFLPSSTRVPYPVQRRRTGFRISECLRKYDSASGSGQLQERQDSESKSEVGEPRALRHGDLGRDAGQLDNSKSGLNSSDCKVSPTIEDPPLKKSGKVFPTFEVPSLKKSDLNKYEKRKVNVDRLT